MIVFSLQPLTPFIMSKHSKQLWIGIFFFRFPSLSLQPLKNISHMSNIETFQWQRYPSLILFLFVVIFFHKLYMHINNFPNRPFHLPDMRFNPLQYGPKPIPFGKQLMFHVNKIFRNVIYPHMCSHLKYHRVTLSLLFLLLVHPLLHNSFPRIPTPIQYFLRHVLQFGVITGVYLHLHPTQKLPPPDSWTREYILPNLLQYAPIAPLYLTIASMVINHYDHMMYT